VKVHFDQFSCESTAGGKVTLKMIQKQVETCQKNYCVKC